ncbi:MAG: hypothetical protein IJZ90_04890, partial [Clostridia bacterium]|nr:hypothetical protein [Clostridia bacterium]
MTDGCDREQRNSSDNNCLYDMAGFNSLLLLSFTSDEYFKLSADRSMLVRQDFGAYITLQVIDLIHTEPDVLQEQFLSFADESKYSPSARSIFRYFIFSVDDYSKYTDSFSPVFKNITEKCMKNGVVADFIIADLRNGTVKTTDGKRVGDKKIRNVIEKAIESYTQSQEHGKSAESIIKEKRNEKVTWK